jgi:4-aminobutyrate aminotransferase
LAKIPDIKVEPPGPKARQIVEQDKRYIATSTKCEPVAAQSAKGGLVYDVDGNTFLDFASGVSVLNVGHSHPKVIKAIKDQAERLVHFAGTDFYYSAQVELARRLAESTPGSFEKKVFFSNSGTECVEAAMKLSRWATGRKQYLAFIGCFHGRTLGALSLTSSKPVQRERYFPLVPGVEHIPYANCYRCPYQKEYPSCGIYCAKILEEVYFQSYVLPQEIGALFMEPVQGENGYIVPPKDFVQGIAKICKKYGILFVDDEVQAGMGRTGKMWAIEHFDVVPDIVCSAKALGSGIPIAATVFPKELDFGPSAHSNTYGGNLVACASSLATFDVMEEEKLLQQATKKGAYLHKRLLELKEKYELIGDVRGLGLMQATELVKDRKTKEYAVEERDRIIDVCFKRGLIVLPAGRSTIRYIPPLNESTEFLDAGIEVLDSALRDVHK